MSVLDKVQIILFSPQLALWVKILPIPNMIHVSGNLLVVVDNLEEPKYVRVATLTVGDVIVEVEEKEKYFVILKRKLRERECTPGKKEEQIKKEERIKGERNTL
jgi:hypothetical protein